MYRYATTVDDYIYISAVIYLYGQGCLQRNSRKGRQGYM